MKNPLSFDTEKARQKRLDWQCRPVIHPINDDWKRELSGREDDQPCSCGERYLNQGLMNYMSMYGYRP